VLEWSHLARESTLPCMLAHRAGGRVWVQTNERGSWASLAGCLPLCSTAVPITKQSLVCHSGLKVSGSE
jgi:hypothetical protein